MQIKALGEQLMFHLGSRLHHQRETVTGDLLS